MALADIKARELEMLVRSKTQIKGTENNILHSLIMHFCRLDVRRDRSSEIAELCYIRSSRDVDALSMIVQGRVGGSERRWETVVHGRVQ